jgi:hypothetical protein
MTAPNPYEQALAQALDDERMARERAETARQKVLEEEARVAHFRALVDTLMTVIPVNSRAFFTGKIAGIRPTTGKRGSTALEAVNTLIDRLPHREWTAPEIQELLKVNGLIIEIEQVHNLLNYLWRRDRIARSTRGRYMPLGMARALQQAEELAS